MHRSTTASESCQPADAPDFATLRRVLVVKMRYHGDVLLASPVFHVLKRAYPHLEVDALVYRETAAMLSGHPDIDLVHCVDRRDSFDGVWSYLKGELALWQALRIRRYDLVIHLTEHWRGVMLKHLLGIPVAVVARYRRRTGWFWTRSFTHHYPVPVAPRHKAESHLDALRRIGVQPAEVSDRRLSLAFSEDEAVSARDKRRTAGLAEDGYVLVHPTSRFAYKCWQAERMAELIDRIEAAGKRVLITCAPDAGERRMVDAILAKTHSKPASLAGALTLKELAASIAAARMFIGVDSAPMHMAAAVGTPLVALFGPSNQGVWGPWMVEHRIVSTRQTCQPCQLRGCGDGQLSDCLYEIGVEQAWSAVHQILALAHSVPVSLREKIG